MKIDFQTIKNSLAPAVIAKAIKTFDRATIIVVLMSWGAAITIMVFALYTLNLSITAKRDALTAAATEPGLPKIITKPIESAELQTLMDRLKKRFSDIKFDMSREKTLMVSTGDVNNFRLWLTVLSYIDTVMPQYRWTIKEFCAGSKCERGLPMKAVLIAEKVTFSTPQQK